MASVIIGSVTCLYSICSPLISMWSYPFLKMSVWGRAGSMKKCGHVIGMTDVVIIHHWCQGTPFQPLTSTHLRHTPSHSVTSPWHLRDISVTSPWHLRDISVTSPWYSVTFLLTSIKDSVYTIVLTYHCSILSLLIVVYNLGLILAEDPSYSFRTSC